MHSAKVICDSISPNDHRLTTLEVVFPRIVLSEFNTHRVFSRNSASSRAIPVAKMLKMVQESPYVPEIFWENQKGMQEGPPLTGASADRAKDIWLEAKDAAVAQANKLVECNVHKGYANRILEPYMWHTVIVTASEWSNFLNLRCHKAAHFEIRKVAKLMAKAMTLSVPEPLEVGEWHLPYTSQEERSSFDLETLKAISTGRCARVSYLTQDGIRDPKADVDLHTRLISGGHMSPTEHVATPISRLRMSMSLIWPHLKWSGNFLGWHQYRKEIHMEHDMLAQQNENTYD